MTQHFLDIASTPRVRAAQQAMGMARERAEREFSHSADHFAADERQFISEADTFFMATTSETGWPYVQHRGGPRGFLKVVDDHTLAFADYRGNRQYVSVGNVAGSARAALILMDLPRKARLKIYAHVEILAPGVDAALTQLVTAPSYKARMERIFRLTLEAYDWNCPQHITPRFTEEEIDEAVRPLRERLAALEAENRLLRREAAK
ncbi:MAG: pyridoxamine 5'-phosphate oxidase family protein [Steroidobacteraceae bacterium]